MAQDKTVDAFFVSSLNEALQQLKNISGLSVLAGCTTCPSYCDGTKIKLPPSVLFVKYVPELQAIARKERFIEFGSAVTLNAILDLGKNRIPSFFYDAVASVAFHNVRNLATLGGNICKGDHKMSLYSPLLAMDAVLEFKSYAETKRIAMSKFTGVPDKFLLTKIHIPVEDWSTAYFKRLGPAYKMNELFLYLFSRYFKRQHRRYTRRFLRSLSRAQQRIGKQRYRFTFAAGRTRYRKLFGKSRRSIRTKKTTKRKAGCPYFKRTIFKFAAPLA